MAYRQFGRGGGVAGGGRTMTTVAVKPVKAKCAENQRLVDILLEKRAKIDSSNYAHTLRKATDSIGKHGEPVTSFKEAKALKGIGDHVASMLFPSRKDVTPPSPASSHASSVNATPSAGRSSKNATKRKRPPPPGKNLATIQEQPSTYQLAYDKAVQESNLYKTQRLNWKVVLLIDLREKKSEHMIAKCQMSGIPCEERPLPIGDMAWIAQGLDKKRNVVTELMLGTIVERKTTSDLKASLFGTRYNEQQLRLQHSGLPQVLFLIEGDISKDLHCCPAETIHTVLFDIRLHHGNSIVQTAHMEETVRTLKRMHRRVLQRSFPAAFRDTALPDFSEADRQRRRSSGQGIGGEEASGSGRKNRGRRRLSSLMEMTFDTDPSLIPNMERFVTYNELKAKIELDRQLGTRTTGSIHARMLKQVASFSDRKVVALCRQYATTNQLFSAFHQATDKPGMVKDMAISEPGSAALRKVGPKSSEELYVAYCGTGGSGIAPRIPSTPLGTKRKSPTKPSPVGNDESPAVTSLPLESPDSNPWWKDDPAVAKYLGPEVAAGTPSSIHISTDAAASANAASTTRTGQITQPTSLFQNDPPVKSKVTTTSSKTVVSCIDLLSSSDEEDRPFDDDKKPKAKRKTPPVQSFSPCISSSSGSRQSSSPHNKGAQLGVVKKSVTAKLFDFSSSSDDCSLNETAATVSKRKKTKVVPKSPTVFVID